jgi:hypothetical protein
MRITGYHRENNSLVHYGPKRSAHNTPTGSPPVTS